MKSILYRGFGPARDVLTLEESETPTPAPGEVLVALSFSGVNPSDVKLRAGARAVGGGMPFPAITPHSDGSGEIIAVGEGVSADRIGQRVWIRNGQWQRAGGTAASHISLPADLVFALPDSVDLQTGAILGIPGLTATYAVFNGGDVAGQTVLVQGAAGTVGLLAVQLAKWGGAKVIATARGTGAERAFAAGAHAVIDFTAPDLVEQILAANDGAPVDRIVEVEFGRNAATDAAVIAENGRICAFGSALDTEPAMPFYPLMFKAVTLELALIYLLTPEQVRSNVDRLHAALVEGGLTCPVEQVFDMADCAAAHEAVEAGNRAGAILVRTS